MTTGVDVPGELHAHFDAGFLAASGVGGCEKKLYSIALIKVCVTGYSTAFYSKSSTTASVLSATSSKLTDAQPTITSGSWVESSSKPTFLRVDTAGILAVFQPQWV